MRAKICGITDVEDALYAIGQGTWALGFNFYSQSPRYIEPSAAKHLIRQLPTSVLKVGIVMDASPAELDDLMTNVGLDLVQVYADEGDVPLALKKRMILALQASTVDELPPECTLNEYAYLLLDAPKRADGLMGGTGRVGNWTLASALARTYRLILAGGLTVENIQSAMRMVRPYAVDVASGVQRIPGRLDYQFVKDVLDRVND